MGTRESRDLITAAGLLFEAAAYLHRAISTDVERATGLPGTWMEVLLRLSRTPGAAERINELAAHISFAPSSFSRLADRMEGHGLVRREPDPTNRRATLLHLTTAGNERLAEANRVHEPSLHTRFANLLTDDELDTLEIITRRLRDANDPRGSTGTTPPETEPRTAPGMC